MCIVWYTMVKFEPFDANTLTDNLRRDAHENLRGSTFHENEHLMAAYSLEKLRDDAEVAITALENKFASIDGICMAATDTIVYLTEHSVILETSYKKTTELVVELSDHNQDLGKAHDIMEEIVVELKKRCKNLEEANHDLNDRMALFEETYGDDMTKLDTSNMLMSSVCFIGLLALGLLVVFFSL